MHLFCNQGKRECYLHRAQFKFKINYIMKVLKKGQEAEYKPQVGDLFLVKGKNFIAKAIQFWMKIYRKLRNKEVYDTTILNHAGTVINLWGTLVVAEAVATGIEARVPVDIYLQKKKVIVRRFKRQLTPKEKKLTSQTAIGFMTIPHRYDFLTFIFSMYMIVTGKWIGPKGKKSQKRLYCSEFSALLMDIVRNTFHGKTWDKNPEDLLQETSMKTVYKNF